MPTMVKRKCKTCGVEIEVRAVDVKRGWGKFCSKSCKAREQEKRTHQNARHHARKTSGVLDDCAISEFDFGDIDGHGPFNE